MNEKRRRLYELVEICDLEGEGTGEFVFVVKSQVLKDWQAYLEPVEILKLQTLPEEIQLKVAMSTDPFRALDEA